MSSSSSQADLLLLASRYSTGELSPAEALAFEDQLARDQRAREALLDVMQIEALLLRERPPIRDRMSRPATSAAGLSRRYSQFVLAMAGSALACGLLLLLNGPSVPVPGGNSSSESTLSTTAAVWTALARHESAFPEEPDESRHLSPVEVPDWMFAAVGVDDVEQREPKLDEEDLL